MNIGSVEDRLAIRELIDTFAAGVMRIDSEYWGETWAPDGAWKLPSLPEDCVGKDNIKAMFKEKLAYAESISMIAFPADTVVDGDTAEGKAYCRELIYTKEGAQKILFGCFHDQYIKLDGQWLFQRREYEILSVH